MFLKGKNTEFNISPDGILHFKGRISILDDSQLKEQIFFKENSTPYSVNPGTTKMYKDFKERLWWIGMKREILKFVAKCLIC